MKQANFPATGACPRGSRACAILYRPTALTSDGFLGLCCRFRFRKRRFPLAIRSHRGLCQQRQSSATVARHLDAAFASQKVPFLHESTCRLRHGRQHPKPTTLGQEFGSPCRVDTQAGEEGRLVPLHVHPAGHFAHPVRGDDRRFARPVLVHREEDHLHVRQRHLHARPGEDRPRVRRLGEDRSDAILPRSASRLRSYRASSERSPHWQFRPPRSRRSYLRPARQAPA